MLPLYTYNISLLSILMVPTLPYILIVIIVVILSSYTFTYLAFTLNIFLTVTFTLTTHHRNRLYSASPYLLLLPLFLLHLLLTDTSLIF